MPSGEGLGLTCPGWRYGQLVAPSHDARPRHHANGRDRATARDRETTARDREPTARDREPPRATANHARARGPPHATRPRAVRRTVGACRRYEPLDPTAPRPAYRPTSVATQLQLPRSIAIEGQASRRGLIPRMPAGERLLAGVGTWLATEYGDQLRATRTHLPVEGVAELSVSLHPAAADVVLTAADTGQVTVRAETAATGPGYHRFVGRVLERMAVDASIEWATEDGDAFAFAERPIVERAYLGWLGPTLGLARNARRRGVSGIQLGLPDWTRYTFDGAIATALGPRDDAWLEAAIGNRRIAQEITPWWSDATDPRYLLDRALVLMWTEVRWRSPVIDEEAQVLDDVHRLLSRAYPIEPHLPYPWHEWAEIVAYRGIDDGMARQVIARAGDGPPSTPEPIGYRRRPVRITHEGWSLEIPGDFAERRTTDEWWGGGPGRRITIAAVATGPMTAQAFVNQFAADLGDEGLTHQSGELVGRARISTDPSSGLEIGVLEGYSAVTGSGAAIRIEFDDGADYRWAIDLWRSLAPG